ncbi:hypothetical protein PMAYCL1PPCAC_20962, partial [Pristionchus mayeri]
MDMIRQWGYPAEKHDVQTEDGFILTMFRIPHGRFSDATWWCQRPVVVFFHALMASGTEFFLNPPESSLAFLLAEAGFDVFLINHRGTTYSKRHVTLKPTDNKFWQWTMDELAKYDSPAAIDAALAISGQKQAYWVGHSMGTTVGYMMLAARPNYNDKIKALFQLAPTGTAAFAVGPIDIIFSAYAHLRNLISVYQRVYGSHEIAYSLPFLNPTIAKMCLSIPFEWEVRRYAITNLILNNKTSKLQSRAPVYMANYPAGTSTWNLLHYFQMASARRIERFDHGSMENLRRYGVEKPPAYDYGLINVPVYHFWSRSDFIVPREDMDETIMETLSTHLVKQWIHIAGYNHFDFALALNIKEKVAEPIIAAVLKQERGMC